MRLYNSDGSQNKSILPIVLLIIVAAVVLLNFEPPGKRAAIGGIPDPVQKAANGSTVIHRDGYSVAVTYLYEYEIEALVLSTHKYPGYNVLDKIAPKDLARLAKSMLVPRTILRSISTGAVREVLFLAY